MSDTSSGRMRDALVGIHNLETLLASPRIGHKTLRELVPELFACVSSLRREFGTARGPAGAELSTFGEAVLGPLGASLRSLAAPDLDVKGRLAAEREVRAARQALDTVAELVGLLERSERPRLLEVTLPAFLHEALPGGVMMRPSSSVDVAIVHAAGDAVVVVDPKLASRVLLVLCGLVAEPLGGAPIELVAEADEDALVLRIGPVSGPVPQLATLPRVRPIAPTETTVRRSCLSAGWTLSERDAGHTLCIPRQPAGPSRASK